MLDHHQLQQTSFKHSTVSIQSHALVRTSSFAELCLFILPVFCPLIYSVKSAEKHFVFSPKISQNLLVLHSVNAEQH